MVLFPLLFFISQTSYRTYKIISSYELARPVMGTIFLVNEDVGLFCLLKKVRKQGIHTYSLYVFNERALCVGIGVKHLYVHNILGIVCFYDTIHSFL